MDRKNLFVAGLAASFALAASGAWADETKSGQPVTDSVITTKVKAELAKDDETKARHIKVHTKNGVVHLSGSVDSSAEKSKAEQDAQAVEGVTQVENSLKVKTAAASGS
jgi:osmotically-inducible protein OsmY